MNKKLVGALVALAAAAFAVWFFWLRDRGQAPAQQAPIAASDPWANTGSAGSASTSTPGSEAVPAGLAPRWVRDVDKPGKLQLEGQVIDEEGDPVGGAVVTLSSVPPRTATTEQDGSFAFDKLSSREYGLVAVAGNRVGGPLSHRLTSTSDPVVIRLIAGAKLVVTVVDGSDKPVPKATVKVLGLTEKEGTTGDDGTATLEPVHPGWISVQAHASGYAAASGFTQIGSGGSTGQIKVVLRNGYSVSGRVVDEAGKPIANAHVSTAGTYDIPGSGHSAETDAKGAFTIAALPPGTHTLVARDREHAPARSPAITIDNKAVTGLEIVMQAGGTLTGRVLDANRAPVASATVRVAGDGEQMYIVDSRQTSTDDTGAFELRGLARTKLKVRAESEVGASEIALVDLTTEREKTGLDLLITVTGTIAGIVVDEAGQPVAEVQVNAFPDILGGSTQDAMVLAGMSSALTDGGGRFTIRGLPDGEYRVRAARASGRGRYDWGQQGVKAKTGDSNVKITLSAPGSITGKLVMEDGKPPALANVQIGWLPQEAAKADGTFTLVEVEPGTHDLRVRGPAFAEYVHKDIQVTAGKSTDVGTLTLVRGRKVTGKVVDASGAAVAGAKIKSGDMLYSMQGAEDQMETWEEMAGMKSATSDRDGNFTLIGIAKKSTNVLADHPSKGRSNAVTIPAGTEDPPPITLTLRGFGQIVGTVTSQGKPVGGATISATPKGGGAQVQIVQSEPDGTFVLTKISEGPVVVSAMQSGSLGMSMRSISVETNVTAGKQTKVDIDIPVGSITLTVQVKALPNNKVDSAQVFLMRNIVAVRTAKELTEAFLGGSAAGMKFWLGEGKPAPEFEQLVPGDYSVCTIPITGDLNDPTFQQRLQQNMETLAVHCKQTKVTPSPDKQTFVHEVPAMAPLAQ